MLFKNKVYIAAMAMLLISFVLSACGRDESLDKYKSSMEQYYTNLANINYQMNSLDENSENSSVELLSLLDELDSLTSEMAELEVPKQFELCESLADEAAENMSSAVGLYHQLYSSDEYNESVAEGAYEYYERANKRIVYIKSILHGDTPDELINDGLDDDN